MACPEDNSNNEIEGKIKEVEEHSKIIDEILTTDSGYTKDRVRVRVSQRLQILILTVKILIG